MLQSCHRLGLRPKASEDFRVRLTPPSDDLEGHDSVKAKLAATVDDAHPALPQHLLDLVPGNGWFPREF